MTYKNHFSSNQNLEGGKLGELFIYKMQHPSPFHKYRKNVFAIQFLKI